MKLWKCSICGHVSPWQDDWAVYSSHLIDDEHPSLRIITCSEVCRKRTDYQLKVGKIKLPKITHKGYLSRMTRDPVGYEPQPSQKELLRQFNKQVAEGAG